MGKRSSYSFKKSKSDKHRDELWSNTRINWYASFQNGLLPFQRAQTKDLRQKIGGVGESCVRNRFTSMLKPTFLKVGLDLSGAPNVFTPQLQRMCKEKIQDLRCFQGNCKVV